VIRTDNQERGGDERGGGKEVWKEGGEKKRRGRGNAAFVVAAFV